MIRKHETSVSFKAGVLAIAVHVLLLAAMIVSVSWKAAHAPMVVTEVELWDKIPAPSPSKYKAPVPPEVKPVEAEPPKPEPEVKEEPKAEPVVEQKTKQEAVDIALENKKKELEKQKTLALEKQKSLELEKQEEAERKKELEKLQRALRDDALKSNNAEAKNDALKELQRQALADEQGSDDRKASAATQGVVNEYVSKIKAKIRGNVNKTLCAEVTALSFKVDILPTGDLSGLPRLIKSSGNSVCDEAVERAIMASQPLPLPTEPAAKAEFRNLNLKFTPNG